MKAYTIVIPVYNNEGSLPETFTRLDALRARLVRYELSIIFVVDGARDRSLVLVRQYLATHPRVTVVALTRNFGAVCASLTGLTLFQGDCLSILAADMQDPPELLDEMLLRWEKGSKVVVAIREDRDEPWTTKLWASCFHTIFKKFVMPNYPEKGFDLIVLDKDVVHEINRMNEKNTHISGLICWLGYAQDAVYYKREKRKHGRSQWTFSKKMKYFIDAFVSFSYLPLRVMTGVGVLVSLASFVYALWIALAALRGVLAVSGWATLVVLVSFFSGVMMMMLGLIGEYLWRILDEVRKRPQAVIDRIERSGEA